MKNLCLNALWSPPCFKMVPFSMGFLRSKANFLLWGAGEAIAKLCSFLVAGNISCSVPNVRAVRLFIIAAELTTTTKDI